MRPRGPGPFRPRRRARARPAVGGHRAPGDRRCDARGPGRDRRRGDPEPDHHERSAGDRRPKSPEGPARQSAPRRRQSPPARGARARLHRQGSDPPGRGPCPDPHPRDGRRRGHACGPGRRRDARRDPARGRDRRRRAAPRPRRRDGGGGGPPEDRRLPAHHAAQRRRAEHPGDEGERRGARHPHPGHGQGGLDGGPQEPAPLGHRDHQVRRHAQPARGHPARHRPEPRMDQGVRRGPQPGAQPEDPAGAVGPVPGTPRDARPAHHLRRQERSRAGAPHGPQHVPGAHPAGEEDLQEGALMRFLKAIRNLLGNYQLKSGIYHYDRGETQQAIDYLNRTLQAPDSTEPDRRMALYYLTQAYISQAEKCEDASDMEKAAEAYRQALAMTPDYPDLHFRLGSLYARFGLDGDAIAALRRACELHPEYMEARVQLALLLVKTRETEAAAREFGAVRDLAIRSIDQPYAAGRRSLERGDLEEAEACMRSAFLRRPETFDFHYRRG